MIRFVTSSNNSSSHETTPPRGRGWLKLGVTGLALLGGAQGRALTQAFATQDLAPGALPPPPPPQSPPPAAPMLSPPPPQTFSPPPSLMSPPPQTFSPPPVALPPPSFISPPPQTFSPPPVPVPPPALSPPAPSPPPLPTLPPVTTPGMAPAAAPSWFTPAPGPTAGNSSLPPGQLQEKVPVGELAPTELYPTQVLTAPNWIANPNLTSGFVLAYSGNLNHTDVPGLGPVVLPSPFSGIAGNGPVNRFSPWYDYVTQPVVPNGVTYTTTMQGPDYYYGVILDRGDNFRIGANDVHQGQVANCGVGAAIIALAEVGFFEQTIPVGIANGAPRPYFNVQLWHNGVLDIQHIDDMLPWVNDNFLSYQPTPDALNTPANDINANTVLAVPYIEKGLAKFIDRHPELKANASLVGYAGLTDIPAGEVMSAIRNVPMTYIARNEKDESTWSGAVADCIFTPTYPCVFVTPTKVGDLSTMGDSYNAATQTVSWNGDSDTMQWVTHSNDLLIYTRPGNAPWVFVADHAYGMMRSGPFGFATLGNPWSFNPDQYDSVAGGMAITMPPVVLERMSVALYR